MKEAIENHLADFSRALHSDVPDDAREVIIRFRRDDLLDFSRIVGDIDASDLRPEHITQYIAALDQQNTDKLSREVKLSYLRDFCEWLVRKRVLKTNFVPARLCGSWMERTRASRQIIGHAALCLLVAVLVVAMLYVAGLAIKKYR
jgi:site-specific recombinase XerC